MESFTDSQLILSAPVSVKLEPDGTLDLDGAAKPVWFGGGAWGPSGPGAGRAVCTAGLVSNLKQLAYPEGGLGAVRSQRRAPPCSKEPLCARPCGLTCGDLLSSQMSAGVEGTMKRKAWKRK